MKGGSFGVVAVVLFGSGVQRRLLCDNSCGCAVEGHCGGRQRQCHENEKRTGQMYTWNDVAGLIKHVLWKP